MVNGYTIVLLIKEGCNDYAEALAMTEEYIVLPFYKIELYFIVK